MHITINPSEYLIMNIVDLVTYTHEKKNVEKKDS